MTPAALSMPAYEAVAEVTGVRDPYAASKRETNRAALEILPAIREDVRAAGDPLAKALHAAAAGNVIDLGIAHAFDIATDIRAIMRQSFAIDATREFRDDLARAGRVLYLGDNAGEIVFDRLVVEQLLAHGFAVTFTVKSAPIINDATMEDARAAGITELVPVVETGSGDIGVNWARASREFRAAFEQADLVLAKGHGNFETCNDRPERIYFLLKAKCPVVAAALGCREGEIVFTRR
jgi:uncharacterized protein with ATP-grasp and redox domains